MNNLETLLSQLIVAIANLQDDVRIIRQAVVSDTSALVALHAGERETVEVE